MSAYSLQFRDAYHTQFTIPAYLLEKFELDVYKRLDWSAAYFLKQWESNIGTYAAGTIRRYNHIFHVSFCTDCNIGRIKQKLQDNPNLQLILSFRKSPKMPAYVIVDFKKEDY